MNSTQVGMLVSTSTSGNSIAFGKALRGATATDIPVISHNGFGQATNPSDFLAVPSTHMMTAETAAISGPRISLPTLPISLEGLDLDWGRWDTNEVLVYSRGSRSVPVKDVEWVILQPANMADLTGSYTYSSQLSRSTGVSGALSSSAVNMGFDIDLGTGVITNGTLVIQDASTWTAGFTGTMSGSYATMTTPTGTYGTAPITGGDIRGVFVGTGPTGLLPDQRPDFVGGFSLQAGSDSVQGLSVLSGTALPH